MLANVYLHEVLDVRFEKEVRPRLRGKATLCRYADDFVGVFTEEADARRVMEVLPKRFGKYGLTLHPDKTGLIPFRPPVDRKGTGSEGNAKGPGRFDLLGFTHFWGRSRRGYWVVKRKTAKGRFGRALGRIAEWCRKTRHKPIPEQHKGLRQKLQGHYGYYGITGNSQALVRFKFEVERIWRKWLGTRSWHTPRSWAWFMDLLRRHPLPPPRAVHSVLAHAANL